MKKSILSLMGLALIAGSVFTSCKKDSTDPTQPQPDKPTVSFTKPAGGTTEVTVGSTVDMEVIATASNGRKLKKLRVEYSFNGSPFTIVSGTDTTLTSTPTTFTYHRSLPAGITTGTVSYKLVATDDKDAEGSGTLTITVVNGDVNLGAAASSEWKRIGSAAGTGVTTVGLSWTSNTGTSAVIKKGTASKLVILTAAEWTSITTESGLKTAVDNGTDVTEYTGIPSSANNSNINEVIATKVGTKYYLIHVISSTSTTGGAGTTITAQTEYKATM